MQQIYEIKKQKLIGKEKSVKRKKKGLQNETPPQKKKQMDKEKKRENSGIDKNESSKMRNVRKKKYLKK